MARGVLVGVLAAGAGLVGACGHGEPGQENGKRGSGAGAAERPAVAVVLAPVERRDLDDVLQVSGTLHGEEDTVIAAKQAGRIVAVMKDVGDSVEPGEALAQIDRTDYLLALEERRAEAAAALASLGLTELPPEEYDVSPLPSVARARAAAANAEAKYERARRLSEQQPPLISEQDFADIRTAWEVARNEESVEALAARSALATARALNAAVRTAEQRLADTVIAAPGGGTREGMRYGVAERMVSVGEYVEAGREAFRLVASEVIKYRVRVPEVFSARVEVDQTARVWTARGARSAEGRVARVSPVVDPTNRMFMVEIEVENEDGVLKPGAFAEGGIVVGKRAGAALVPEVAVITFAGSHRVFSVSGGKAVEHRVELGERRDGWVEIVKGLDAAVESVVVKGQGELAKDVPVRGGAGADAGAESPAAR